MYLQMAINYISYCATLCHLKFIQHKFLSERFVKKQHLHRQKRAAYPSSCLETFGNWRVIHGETVENRLPREHL